MAKSYTGGCACGAVRYEIAAEPRMSVQCQCRDCQRASGGGHVSAIAFARSAMKLTGEIRYHTVKGDSGHDVDRGFCPRCGSPLIGIPRVVPDMVTVNVGGLDDPGRFAPQLVVYASRGHAWDKLDPAIPKFPEMPPRP